MNYFNEDGRRVSSLEHRVYDSVPKNYYQIKKRDVNYYEILNNSIEFGVVGSELTLSEFEAACEKLKNEIQNNPDFKNLFKGVHIPFICNKKEAVGDLGYELEVVDLSNFQRAFNAKYPEYHFKAVLQGNSKLQGNILLDSRSRYDQFIEKSKKSTIVGWYFPQALQEFDIESQRKQMLELPEIGDFCLSGGADVMAALIGSPDLLINENFYSPILCLSSYVHADPRLVLLLKSYGPHMEFWCMTQMLTKDITQVSEQWSGGITFYASL